LSDLCSRYWILCMKHKRSVEIQTKLTNADMEVNVFRALYRNVVWVFAVHRKSLWVVRFLSAGFAQKRQFHELKITILRRINQLYCLK